MIDSLAFPVFFPLVHTLLLSLLKMGSSVSTDVVVSMTSIDGQSSAGKTTILYKLVLGDQVFTPMPTIGTNIETVKYKGYNFILRDTGAHGDKLRPLWRHVFADAHCLAFVIDASDHASMGEAREVFQEYLYSRDEYKDKLFLILANKQDLPNCMTEEEIVQKLGLREREDRTWYIQPTSAFTRQGLYEALDWIIEQLSGRS